MNINVKIDNSYEQKFKEFKTLFKCKTNDETIKKIMDLAQEQLQQELLKNLHQSNPSDKLISNKSTNMVRNGVL